MPPQALGRTRDVGAIAVGRYGDLVAVTGDPLRERPPARSAAAVVKGGMLIERAAEPMRLAGQLHGTGDRAP